MVKAWLKAKREIPVLQGHPWIFSQAIQRVEGEGPIVEVRNHQGTVLGWGLYNPQSQIRIRMLDYQPYRPTRKAVIVERLRDAVSLRRDFVDNRHTNAFRLINSEGDHLSGLIVDIYGETMVVCLLCRGWEEVKGEWLYPALRKVWSSRYILEKNDLPVRKIERLTLQNRWVGQPPPLPLEIKENGLTFFVDPEKGQKTGFYLDQRTSREWVLPIAGGREILNLFSYTGGFSVYALKGGARSVENVDSSLPALDLAEKNHKANGLKGATFIKEDGFQYLRYQVRQKRFYDMIILDPPALAKSSHHVKEALKGYRDLNVHAMRLIKPGGFLLTCSCSAHVNRRDFLKVLQNAAHDARVSMKILKEGGISWDHPINPACLDSDYLKTFLLRIFC